MMIGVHGDETLYVGGIAFAVGVRPWQADRVRGCAGPTGRRSWGCARLHGANWATRGLYAKQQGWTGRPSWSSARLHGGNWAAELVFCEVAWGQLGSRVGLLRGCMGATGQPGGSMLNSKDGSGQPSWSFARLHGGNWAARGLYAKQQGRIWAAELVFCEGVGYPGAVLGKLDLPEPSTCTAVSPGHRLSRCGSPTSSWAGVRMVRLGSVVVRVQYVLALGAEVPRGRFNAGRVEGTRLPAGGLLHLLPAGGLLHLLPAGGLLHLLPAGALLHLQPAGVVPPTATTAGLSRLACQTGRYTQPSPPDARTPAKWHLLLGQNPPLTHGDPAEAGPPGQSQPSHVHPVKQRAGAMRTRTGTRPSSTSCASPVPWICAHLPTRSGGGRHPQTRPTGPPPCGIPRQKPSKWRTATPPRVPPLLLLPAYSPAHWFNSL
jgi:hypothetical protein